jgi:hypothetical protein
MGLVLRVKLITGDSHRVPIPEDDPDTVVKKIVASESPFAQDWVEAADGELIRVSAIVSVQIEQGGRRTAS